MRQVRNPPLALYTLCATAARCFVDTLSRGPENGFIPFQIYLPVLADAHSCR
jgi:hypothetical protein